MGPGREESNIRQGASSKLGIETKTKKQARIKAFSRQCILREKSKVFKKRFLKQKTKWSVWLQLNKLGRK